LVPQDGNTQLSFYDARVDGGFPAPAAPPSCEGEGCQGAAEVTPSLTTPSSASGLLSGNLVPPAPASAAPKNSTPAQTKAARLARALKACRSKRRAKRGACEALARKRYGAKRRVAVKKIDRRSK
jgi:hypothetical protein